MEPTSDNEQTPVLYFLNGPNLNLSGERKPEVDGSSTLDVVERSCRELCGAVGMAVEFCHANSEGSLIDQIHAARHSRGIVINPAGCSYSVAVFDALKACEAPIVEIHISNIHAHNEAWSAEALTASVAKGVISGLGMDGYQLAAEFLLSLYAVSTA